MDSSSVGAVFKKLRKYHRITLNDAVQGAGCSSAALSRFENGQTDLSVDTATKIIRNLFLDPNDFVHYAAFSKGEIQSDTLTRFIAGKTASLQVDASEFAQVHQDDQQLPYIVYSKFLYRMMLKPANENYRLSPDEEQAVQHILRPSVLWGVSRIQELTIFTAMRFASDELLTSIINELMGYFKEFNQENISQSQVPARGAAILLLQALNRRKLGLAQEFSAELYRYHRLRRQLKDWQSPNCYISLQDAPYVEFGRLATVWAENQTQAAADDLLQVGTQLKQVNYHAGARYLKGQWEQLQLGRFGWHNPELPEMTPAGKDIDCSLKFDGTSIRLAREIMGLSMDDVSVNWTRATQSRFESGKTALGFKDSIALCAALFLDKEVFFGSLHTHLLVREFALKIPTFAGLPKAEYIKAVKSGLAELVEGQPQTSKVLLAFQRIAAVAFARNILIQECAFTEDEADQIMDVETAASDVLSGLGEIQHLTPGDVGNLSMCASVMNEKDALRVYRYLIAHKTYSFTKTFNNNLVLYANGFALLGNLQALTIVDHSLVEIRKDAFNLYMGAVGTYVSLLAEMYKHYEQGELIWQKIAEADAIMRRFAQPDDPHLWLGNMFDSALTTIRPVFDAYVRRLAK